MPKEDLPLGDPDIACKLRLRSTNMIMEDVKLTISRSRSTHPLDVH
jgi:hypothetical protein